MKVTTSGIDVAKSVFQVHGVDEHGTVVLRRQLRRSQLVLFFSRLEPCLIGMEACASSHYWARKLTALGHTVRLMAPQFVKPYRKNDKNDGNDAEAICEAVQRPNMRFVPVKTPQQQAELAVHRIRRRLMAQRTALLNQMRGLLGDSAWCSRRVPTTCEANCRQCLMKAAAKRCRRSLRSSSAIYMRSFFSSSSASTPTIERSSGCTAPMLYASAWGSKKESVRLLPRRSSPRSRTPPSSKTAGNAPRGLA
jgi:Transposase